MGSPDGVGLCTDIPAFPGFYDYAKLVGSSSVLAAELLCQRSHDLVLNWLGGFHHAKRAKASGFCYVNDCVLAILRLLLDFRRVLYVDIDVHHGDGVEEAFLCTSRVLTLSFHQYEPERYFFPGTGGPADAGCGEGRFYAVNVPLRRGIRDANYALVFDSVFRRAVEAYRPDAIVLQSGADSLAGDAIGGFNLSFEGHGHAFKAVLDQHLPTLCLGGGGYTVENVTRCWTYESALALDVTLDETLPENLEYRGSYSSKYLAYQPCNGQAGPDLNDHRSLAATICAAQRRLQRIAPAAAFLDASDAQQRFAELQERGGSPSLLTDLSEEER